MGRFKKGQSGNPAGKPKGAKHKPKKLRLMISEFLNENFESVIEDWKKLSARDRTRFYTDLLAYGTPKLQAVNVTSDIQKQLEAFSDEQLLELMDSIVQKHTIPIKQIEHDNN